MDFKKKKITVFGLGILGGGIGTCQYLAGKGAKLTVTDLRSPAELKEALTVLADLPIKFVLGKHRAEDFLEADLILRNPGVPSESEFLKLAFARKIPVEMAESLLLKLSPTKAIVGITGTRGKSTTTKLIYEILKATFSDVHLAGNFRGTSSLLLLNKLTPASKVVLELSSWQLQSFAWHKISPHVAVVTNVYEDHLNRYRSMAEYIADKQAIFAYQRQDDFVVLNRENAVTTKMARKAPGKVVFFQAADWPQSWSLNLEGQHSRANAAAALQVARLFNVPDAQTRTVAAGFKTPPGRLETVAHFGQVRVINDTTSTTPVATLAALRSFPKAEIILIAGGKSKNLAVGELAAMIRQRVKTLILLPGSGTDELLVALKGFTAVQGPFAELKLAVRKALTAAGRKGLVLFSPGFTSFAQFKNEFDRGEQFNDVIKTFLKKKN